MCRFVETIRVEHGVFQHLDYHQCRLDRTLTQFGAGSVWQLSQCLAIPEGLDDAVYKCRVVYDVQIRDVTFERYTPRQIRTLMPVFAEEVDYAFKYEDRSCLMALLDLKGTADDILIVRNGFLTDTSFSNIALFDGNEWVTPDTYLLNGTCRQRLLEEGVLREVTLRWEDLRNFSVVKPINAMLDFDKTSLAEVLAPVTKGL